jgi:hypothetical protein
VGPPLLLPSTAALTQDKANCLNLTHQTVIGAKELATEDITMKVGTDVTNAVLNTGNGSDFKSINDWQLEDVLTTIVQGAHSPNTANILKQLLHIIQFTFDFCQEVSANMNLLHSKAGRMHSYGVTIDDIQLALLLLANIALATSENWGQEFCPTIQTIHRRYAYNYVHDTASITDMLCELASADGIRKLNDVPVPSGTDNTVTDHVSLFMQLLLQQVMESKAETNDYTSAVYSEISSSVETPCKQ